MNNLEITVIGRGGGGGCLLKQNSVTYGYVRCYSHEHEDPRVETVGPARVRSGRQFVSLEQVVDVLQYESVGVDEDALRVLRQPPAVDLRERNAQLRPTGQ